MTFPVKIVVRNKGKQVRAGFASELPLHQGWKTVKEFGSWYGSQMNYKPFKEHLKKAHVYAKKKRTRKK